MALPEIPDKLFFKISEVCEIVGVEPYVLRFWETEFPNFAPEKSKSGHRVYKRKDVENVLRIKELLYEKGFTIAGARKYLARSRGSRKEERDEVLDRIRQGLQDILTLLQRKT
jgi:DNA-binding transcriptional MerR regulator